MSAPLGEGQRHGLVEASPMPLRSDIETFGLIKVVGVGGGGSNAVNRMIRAELMGVEYISVNTDARALLLSDAPHKIRIGDKITKGLGAGADPGIGRKSAEDDSEKLYEALKEADMIFVTAGMGGGTGTGAAPVLAEIAKDIGALTVAVVTKPFSFEGSKRRLLAEQGINDLITVPGLINLDFADVKTIMTSAGSALMGIGTGSGETRAAEAARQAITSPLLEQSIDGARGVLFTITGGPDLTLFEVNEAAEIIHAAADPEANIIFGAVIDERMGADVKISVIPTGFDQTRPLRKLDQPLYRNTVSPPSERAPVAVGSTSTVPAAKTDESKKFDPDDLEVPSFLRRR